MGFHGMRGKKSYTFDYPEEYGKRSLAMGFQGVRGKREEFTEDWGKRAPMGFQGMRGKKNLLDDVQELHKRAIMGFQVINLAFRRNDSRSNFLSLIFIYIIIYIFKNIVRKFKKMT